MPTRTSSPHTLAVTLAVTLALAACGGNTPSDSVAADALAARPLATTASPTALFEWAEQNYKIYFPSSRANQFLAPYTYRFYPETGIYLGVANDHVYVMGGPFGDQPLRVGHVSDFLTSSSGQPAGTGNGCIDLDFMSVPGRHVLVESRTTAPDGTVTSGMKQEWRVLGERSFDGRALLATETLILNPAVTPLPPAAAAASAAR